MTKLLKQVQFRVRAHFGATQRLCGCIPASRIAKGIVFDSMRAGIMLFRDHAYIGGAAADIVLFLRRHALTIGLRRSYSCCCNLQED